MCLLRNNSIIQRNDFQQKQNQHFPLMESKEYQELLHKSQLLHTLRQEQVQYPLRVRR